MSQSIIALSVAILLLSSCSSERSESFVQKWSCEINKEGHLSLICTGSGYLHEWKVRNVIIDEGKAKECENHINRHLLIVCHLDMKDVTVESKNKWAVSEVSFISMLPVGMPNDPISISLVETPFFIPKSIESYLKRQ